jgi:zinc transport system permease protein
VSFWIALAGQPFLQNALAATLLASCACGVIGVFVVLKRIAFLAGGIAHGVLAGMGVAYLFGFSPTVGAMVAAILMAMLLWWLTLRNPRHEEVMIAALWSVGMATGLIMIAKAPGQAPDLMSYLFGNILMVGKDQLMLILALDLLLLLVVAAFFPMLAITTFDEEFARLRGVPVDAVQLLIMLMTAITVVILIQVAGLILVIALLTLPAASVWRSSSITAMIFKATLVSAFTSVTGLWLAYLLDWPTGATMVLTTALFYGVSRFLSHLFAGDEYQLRTRGVS